MQWKEWWTGLDRNEKLGLAGGVAVIGGLAIGILVWTLRPSYEVLFSDLDPQDAVNIANQLGLDGMKYKLETKQGRILVAKQDVYDARMKVMERGLLLRRPVGFELFDDVEFGMTDFTQQINYQRALQGELTRTIMSLDEIEHARLHLVLPEASLFKSSAERPKASLTLIVKRGAKLSGRRVDGIRRLIAAAVPGLVADQVTINDQMGASLAGEDQQMHHTEMVAERIEAKRGYEAYLSRKAQEVLDKAFGSNAATVMVDVQLDHDKRELTREEPLPVPNGVAGAVTRLKTSASRGTAADLDKALKNSTPLGLPGDQRDITAEVDYQVGKQVEHVQVSPGAVRRITVAVLIPRGVDTEVQGRMASLVAMAIGVDESRGDSVAIQEIPQSTVAGASLQLTTTLAEETTPAPAAGEPDVSVWSWTPSTQAAAVAVLALFILLVGRLAFQSGRRQVQRPLSEEEREQLLQQVRAWLEVDKEQTQANTP